MERIELEAFAKLKLVVELDLSWNKLDLIPLQTMRDLTLMRRFTMRGNPLKRLDESTFGYATMSLGTHAQSDTDLALASLKNQFKQNNDFVGKLLYPNDLNTLSRFVETYPGLARYLTSQIMRNQHNKSNLNFWLDKLPVNLNDTFKSSLRNQLLQFALRFMVKTANLTKLPNNNNNKEFLDVEFSAIDDDLEVFNNENNGIEINLGDENNELPESFEVEISEENSIAGGANDVSANLMASNGKLAAQDKTQVQGSFRAMGFYWKHLQELDFGQCQLTYIKWTTFEHLNELKRLYLDGNILR